MEGSHASEEPRAGFQKGLCTSRGAGGVWEAAAHAALLPVPPFASPAARSTTCEAPALG